MAARTKDELIAQARREVSELSPEAARARVEAGGVLVLDVREADEVAAGALPGAVPLPRGVLELRIEGLEPDRDREILVYCAGGARSALAARALAELGYARVHSLAGGFGAWKAQGYPWAVEPSLSPAQRARYARHTLLSEVGEAGQLRLLGAKVLLVGAGGLGSPAALYLAAAGVGTLGLIDPDEVDASNLQRQILYRSADVGAPKVERAARTLGELNPDVQVVRYPTRFDAESAMRVLDDGWEVVVDGSDNFETRYLVNDACFLRRRAHVHGSIFRFQGQVSVFAPHLGGPCYRCLFPAPPPSGMVPACSEAGVLGVLPGVIGTLQAVETLKLLLGRGQPLLGRVLQFEALEMRWRELALRRDPGCALCGDRPTIDTLTASAARCAAP